MKSRSKKAHFVLKWECEIPAVVAESSARGRLEHLCVSCCWNHVYVYICFWLKTIVLCYCASVVSCCTLLVRYLACRDVLSKVLGRTTGLAHFKDLGRFLRTKSHGWFQFVAGGGGGGG